MRVHWTKKALKNLNDIELYITNDNRVAVPDITAQIVLATRHLTTHPHIGRAGRIYGTRELVLANLPYIISYRVKNNQVDILRILHTSMQWPNIF